MEQRKPWWALNKAFKQLCIPKQPKIADIPPPPPPPPPAKKSTCVGRQPSCSRKPSTATERQPSQQSLHRRTSYQDETFFQNDFCNGKDLVPSGDDDDDRSATTAASTQPPSSPESWMLAWVAGGSQATPKMPALPDAVLETRARVEGKVTTVVVRKGTDEGTLLLTTDEKEVVLQAPRLVCRVSSVVLEPEQGTSFVMSPLEDMQDTMLHWRFCLDFVCRR